MAGTHEDRLTRALCSLEGLSVGDAFGERFFLTWDLAYKLVKHGLVAGPPYDMEDEFIIEQIISIREVPGKIPWTFTDDTQMALSVVEILRRYKYIEQGGLALSFGQHYDNTRGYGPAMHQMLPRLALGLPWQHEARSLFGGQGSYGNGAAMRVAPIGAYFADDLSEVVDQAARSAEVTHAHPEAVAGAIGVAVGAALAWQGRADESTIGEKDFLDAVLEHLPASEVRRGVELARDLPHGCSVGEAVEELGNGTDVSAQDTVPFVLWCASQYPNNYEEALWLTVSGLGDRDTTCAMVGGIVAAGTGRDGIPLQWRQSRESLPDWVMGP